ncbi:metallophosphoesterase [Roseateles sp. LYH14W]|uniref:Metallophosphoesterase n=1 Tax=Pelomonas parva TaxID=3299032 RepID=A0ABW7FAC2_9BURK
MRRDEIPFLQIVHYSDMHIVGSQFLKQRHATAKLFKRLPPEWQQGLEGADVSALYAFEEFLRNEISKDSDWGSAPCWLVDTGDGTTFGDDESLTDWLQCWTPRFKAACGQQTSQLVLYGNHDAWPATHPLLAWRGNGGPAQAMTQQRDSLRKRWFPNPLPVAPLAVSVPNSTSEVQLFSLNSVDHGLWPGVLAQGRVLPDQFWKTPPPMVGPTAADDLGRLAQACSSGSGGRDLRILAMHYPVAAGAVPGNPRFQQILTNRQNFGNELLTTRFQQQPLIHLHIGGHTHITHPFIGSFPNTSVSANYPPLPGSSVQHVTASTSQRNIAATPAANPTYAERCQEDFPYQCTVFRLSSNKRNPREVIVRRAIAGCQPGGAFGFLPLAPGSARAYEKLSFVL